MNYLEPERLDALAAQYVLGTLSRAARERLARLARGNESVAAALRAWENRLLPLAESLPPVAPPERVWPAILDRIQGQREPGSIWANLGLWRGLTMAGFATAMALVVVLLTPRPETPSETLVVVLASQDALPALLVSADRSGRTLMVKAIAQVAAELGTQTVAEFVGDDQTQDLLRSYGVDYAQGFHIGVPRPIVETLGQCSHPATT